MRPPHRAAGLLTALSLAVLLTACGRGGFGSEPPPTPDRPIRSYVALGDTFTAAPGVGTTTDADGCKRSDANYPALLAQSLGLDRVEDVSCAGATTTSLTDRVRPARHAPEVPPQLDAVGRDTDLVTIGIGLADRDLLANAFRVCAAVPCGDKVTAETVLGAVDEALRALAAAVREVQDRAPDAYVVLVGYPYLEGDATYTVPSTRKALAPVQAGTRIRALSDAGDALGRAITATMPNTAYVSVTKAFAGHELHAMRPNPQRWFVSPLVDAPLSQVDLWYHPNKAGHAAIAKALFDDVRVPKADVR